VIVSVDQRPVTTPGGAAAQLKQAAAQGNVLLLLNRHGMRRLVGREQRNGRQQPLSRRQPRRSVAEIARNWPRVIVATAGPIDHGKTALVCALTGIDTISSIRPNHRSASFLITLKSRIALPSDAKNATYCAAGRFTSTSMVKNLEN
jgi:hypothetical protein